ncbi:MAG: hypothetical protein GX847_02765 [Clostridiales bacterium]|nr:hypothetical protein [Clostridiales bacterium]
MKKAMAILLACLMAFTLFACNENKAPVETAPPPADDAPAAMTPDSMPDTPGSPPASGNVEIGTYDPDRDYFDREPYSVMYISYQAGSFGELIEMNLQGWASVLNIKFDRLDAQTMDDFYSTMEICANEGYDGFVLDADPTLGAKTLELAEELGIKAWLGATSVIRDDDDTMLWPGVTMDSYWAGQEQMRWAFDNYDNYYDNEVDMSKLGVIFCTYSVIPNLQLVEDGASEWVETNAVPLGFDMGNYFIADATGMGFDAPTAYDLVSAIMSTNSHVENWIVGTCMEPYGVGASRAAEELGKEGSAIVVSQDGTTVFAQWDTGYDGCWVAALTSPLQYFTEPIMCGVLALIEGEATPETLWPDHVQPGNKYANRIVLSTMLTKENYVEFHEELAAKAPF